MKKMKMRLIVTIEKKGCILDEKECFMHNWIELPPLAEGPLCITMVSSSASSSSFSSLPIAST